jgi:hypothetical protein
MGIETDFLIYSKNTPEIEMGKYRITIKTATWEASHFAIARSAKEASDSVVTPDEVFGLTVVAI